MNARTVLWARLRRMPVRQRTIYISVHVLVLLYLVCVTWFFVAYVQQLAACFDATLPGTIAVLAKCLLVWGAVMPAVAGIATGGRLIKPYVK